jgi:ribosome-associated toxin RatA of RatAB toxin-antitoxin module
MLALGAAALAIADEGTERSAGPCPKPQAKVWCSCPAKDYTTTLSCEAAEGGAWCSRGTAYGPCAGALGRGEILLFREERPAGAPVMGFEAVIDAPPERVWAFVSDCGRYQKHMPRIAASKLERREGETVICRVKADMPLPLPDLESVTRGIHREGEGHFSRTWELVEGDYHLNEGAWILTRFEGSPDRTWVRYRIRAEPKLALPSGIVQAAQRRALPDLVARLRSLSKRP